MDRRLSIYLDLLRFLAALLVVAEHVGAFIVPQLGGHTVGREAVVIFFVLSGCVISFVTANKETSWRQYAAARFGRMYTVIPIAIVVTIVCDAVGNHVAPSWYASHVANPYNPHWEWIDVLRYTTFTNELWRSHSVVGTNEPYWSLGFEVPYYLLFGLVYFSRRAASKAAWVIVWLAFFGPKIAIFSPLWFVGLITYQVIRSGVRLPASWTVPTLAATVVGAAFLVRSNPVFGQAMYVWAGMSQDARLAVYTLELALLLGIHIIAFHSLPDRYEIFGARQEALIRWFAGGSFTLYLMHMPILSCLAALFNAPHIGYGLQCFIIMDVLGCCYMLAEVGERRKKLLGAFAWRLLSDHGPKTLIRHIIDVE